MEANILKAVYQLKESLKNDPRILKLNQLENELNNSDEAKILSYRMDQAASRYSDALKIYTKDSEEIKPFVKDLSKAKENLNNLDVVKRYNLAYREVKKIYEEINKIVFDDFNESLQVNK